MPVIINKAAYCNLKSGIPSNSQLISNRAGWIINVEEGVEGAPNNLIDGKTGTDVALNNKGFWFTVDLGEAKVLTGIKTNHWANAYAPREVEILQSENGTTWKSLSSLANLRWYTEYYVHFSYYYAISEISDYYYLYKRSYGCYRI